VNVYANIVEYIKHCRAKIDKLIETAPEIPHHIEERLQSKIKLIKIEENNELNEIITLSNVRNSMCMRVEESEKIQRKDDNDNDNDNDNDHQQERSIRTSSIQSEPPTDIYSQQQNDESPSSSEIQVDEPSGILTLRENSLTKMKFFFSSLDGDGDRNDVDQECK